MGFSWCTIWTRCCGRISGCIQRGSRRRKHWLTCWCLPHLFGRGIIKDHRFGKFRTYMVYFVQKKRWGSLVTGSKKPPILLKKIYVRDPMYRLGICRDRRDQRSCQIFVSCVNFSRKKRSFLHILQVYTHLNVTTFCKRIYTLCSTLTKRGPNYG